MYKRDPRFVQDIFLAEFELGKQKKKKKKKIFLAEILRQLLFIQAFEKELQWGYTHYTKSYYPPGNQHASHF